MDVGVDIVAGLAAADPVAGLLISSSQTVRPWWLCADGVERGELRIGGGQVVEQLGQFGVGEIVVPLKMAD